MTIQEVEKRTGMKRANIRFYERQGLIEPKRQRENKYRDYSEADVEMLQKIAFLRALGFTVDEVRKLKSGELELAQGLKVRRVALRNQQADCERLEHLCGQLEGVKRLEDLPLGRIAETMQTWEQGGREALAIDQDAQDAYQTLVTAGQCLTVLLMFCGAGLWPFVFDYADVGVAAPILLDGNLLFLLSFPMLLFLWWAKRWKRGRGLVYLAMVAFLIYGIATCIGSGVLFVGGIKNKRRPYHLFGAIRSICLCLLLILAHERCVPQKFLAGGHAQFAVNIFVVVF